MTEQTRLHSSAVGDQGSPVVFCHGLFGQGKNWTQIAKRLSGDHRVTLLDMPDHGRSPWSERFDYLAAADLVARAVEEAGQGDPVTLVGHSMGGKIAMLVALRHPELVDRLCVVDVSPVAYPDRDEFGDYMDAMLAVDLDAVESRSDADEALEEAAPHPTIRSFLLQNLQRSDEGGWRWLPNLEVLRRDLAELGGWPADAVENTTYDGPVLWIAGATSPYVTDDYDTAMESLFPRERRVTIKDAGHWVHSEQPEVFTEVLARFLAADGS